MPHTQRFYNCFAPWNEAVAFIQVGASANKLAAMKSLKEYFEPWGMHEFFAGGSGVDIAPLKNYYDDVTLVGLVTDSQRYFDLHHAASDTFDQVNRREMQLGSAAMAPDIYLADVPDLLKGRD